MRAAYPVAGCEDTDAVSFAHDLEQCSPVPAICCRRQHAGGIPHAAATHWQSQSLPRLLGRCCI